jgi:hypothetical protein
MANINDKVQQIRQAMYGKDVRESIASGIEVMNTEVESTTARQNVIDSNEATRQNNEATRVANEENRVTAESTRVTEFNTIKKAYEDAIQEGTVPELTAARHDNVTNTDYANIGARLDAYSTKFGEITDEFNTHRADIVYQVAGGTATAITLTGVVLENGHPKTFIASANNNGAATTINGKPLYKPNTTTAPTLIAGKAYTVWYNSTGDCFFIKASAEGNVTADKVLASYTYSSDEDTGKLGTMTNNGAVILTPSSADQVIPQGYHNGNGMVKAIPVIPGDNIILSLGSASGYYPSYTKVKEATLNRAGTYRFIFGLTCQYNKSDCYAYARLYINDVATGIERVVHSLTTYTTFTEDLSINANDKVELYIRSSGSNGQSADLYDENNVIVNSFNISVGTLPVTVVQNM